MAPIIVFDKNDNFYLTIGSPGGKAIIAYIFKVLSDIFYNNTSLQKHCGESKFYKNKWKNLF